MATVREEIQQVEDGLGPKIDNVTNTLFAAFQILDETKGATVAINQFWQSRSALLDGLGFDVSDIRQIAGQVKTNTDRLQAIETAIVSIDTKLNDTNDRLLQVLAAMALLKLDTAGIASIETKLTSFISGQNMQFIANRVATIETYLYNTIAALYMDAGGFQTFTGPTIQDLLATIQTASVDTANVLNESILTQMGSIQVNTQDALPLLQQIADCSCDGGSQGGLCDEYTAELPGSAIYSPTGLYAINYSGPNGGSGIQNIRAFYLFDTWITPTSSISSGGKTWSTTSGGNAVIYGPSAPNVAIVNNTDVEINFASFNTDLEEWQNGTIPAGQCSQLNGGTANGFVLYSYAIPTSLDIRARVGAVG